MSRIRATVALLATLLALAGTAVAGTIAVPWFGQKTRDDCGRAVLASLAARNGGDPRAQYDRLPVPSSRRGYSVADMERLAGRVAVGLTITSPEGIVVAGMCAPAPHVAAHLRRIARLVDGGTPVVVPVARGGGVGHYLILVGTRADGFAVHDPAVRGVRSMSTAALTAAMCDYGYVALVVR